MLENGWFYENQTENQRLGFKIKEEIYSGQSKFQKIDIFDTEEHGKLFTLDDLVMLTEATEFVYHEMITHIPLCTHKKPKDVLVIGGGDGGTIREVVKHKTIERAVLCEIDGEVIEQSKKHLNFTACELDNPKVQVVVEDGFKFLQENKDSYDVILVDSTDPIGEGAKLFGENFYKLCYSALRKDGILVFQSESPFIHKHIITDVFNNLKPIFKIVKLYTAFIPVYPSGMWSFGFASKSYHPIKDLHKKRAKEISNTTKYYNKKIHESCFSLPNFTKELIK